MRIIAGKHKGLKLETFEVGNIRPTLDRAREGIFNKIQFDVPNSECLDLFGGTGAISLELLSRGASKVTTIDVSNDSCKLIQKNFEKAKESLNLIKMDYMQALEFLKKDRFDMIFLDPPFASDYAKNAIIKIMQEKMLKDGGMIIFEHSFVGEYFDKNFLDQCGLKLIDSKKYGTIAVDFFKEFRCEL